VSRPEATLRGWSPWPCSVYDRLPLSPFAIGAAIAVASFAILVALAWTAGGMREFMQSDRSLLQERDARLAVYLCIFVGFLPTAQYSMVRFTRANLAALAPLLRTGEPAPALPAPSLWLITIPSVLIFPLIAISIDRDPLFYFQPVYFGDATHWFQWIFGIFATTSTGRLGHLTIACARAVGGRADAIARIDLLDLSGLVPFARQSLQMVLVWLLMLSLFAVNAVDPGVLLAVASMTVLCGGLAAATLAICNGKIHRRIREAKRGQIAWVNSALRGEPRAQQQIAIGAPAGDLSASDLLSYRRFLDETREWAFDSSAWLRFALYLAIPLGSWLGGAVVERLLDASLG
jgi:hypothetical protein